MNDINPNNYDGAEVTIVGRAGGEPRETKIGTRELSVGVSQGYKKDGEWVDTGTTWYVLSATIGHAEEHWPYVGKGDKVRFEDAKQETREWTDKDGNTRLQIKLSYGTLSVVQAKNAEATADNFAGEPAF